VADLEADRGRLAEEAGVVHRPDRPDDDVAEGAAGDDAGGPLEVLEEAALLVVDPVAGVLGPAGPVPFDADHAARAGGGEADDVGRRDEAAVEPVEQVGVPDVPPAPG